MGSGLGWMPKAKRFTAKAWEVGIQHFQCGEGLGGGKFWFAALRGGGCKMRTKISGTARVRSSGLGDWVGPPDAERLYNGEKIETL